MTSLQRKQFVQYILESFADPQTLKLVNKHLLNFQDWASKNGMNFGGDQMNLTHAEEMKLQAEKYVKGLKQLRKIDKEEYYRLFTNADLFFESGGFFLNPSGFMKTVEMLGDDQQVKHWVGEVLSGRIVGAYAQTELGHGSNVQGLQTQARYDQNTQTWTFNSQKASSAKFWPGLLGVFCSTVVLQAKAYVNNKSIGVQTFAFSIRDSNLNNLPGVDVGQMGAKLGMAHLDHGFLKFSNFKQPKRAMLMRYIKINEKGEVQGLENKQALKYGYGSMLNLRVFLTYSFGVKAYNALRYASNYFKTAGSLNDSYIKHLLLQGYSVSLGIVIANKQTSKIFIRFTKHMQAKQYNEADKLMNQCHIVSSTLKAVTSWKSMDVIKSLLTFDPILSLRNTFIPKFFCDQVPSVTYQGDNNVLLQLTAKYLLKKQQKSVFKPSSFNPESFDNIQSSFKYCFYKQLQRNKALMVKQMQKGLQLLEIWNEKLQTQFIQLSKLWGRYILVKFYNSSYKQYSGSHKQLINKIGLTFVHSLIKDSRDRFSFYDLDIPKIDCISKFTEQEYHLLGQSSQQSELTKYELSTRGLQQRGRKLEQLLINAKL